MKNKEKNISVISTGSWVPKNLNDVKKNLKTYKICINQLVVDAFIGIHTFEKKKKQKISITLNADVIDQISLLEHKIENFVSYENIVKDIENFVNLGHIDLLETLGEKIVSLCFKDDRIISVNLKLEKLEIMNQTKSVGIEIFREKNFKMKIFKKKNSAFMWIIKIGGSWVKNPALPKLINLPSKVYQTKISNCPWWGCFC